MTYKMSMPIHSGVGRHHFVDGAGLAQVVVLQIVHIAVQGLVGAQLVGVGVAAQQPVAHALGLRHQRAHLLLQRGRVGRQIGQGGEGGSGHHKRSPAAEHLVRPYRGHAAGG